MKLLVQFSRKQDYVGFALHELLSLAHMFGVEPKSVLEKKPEEYDISDNPHVFVTLPSVEVAN